MTRSSKSSRVSVTNESTHCEKWVTHLSSVEEKNKLGVMALLLAILRSYGWSIAKVGILKLVTTALSFVGPVLLGFIVKYLENGVSNQNIGTGVLLIALLGSTSALSAMLNTNYNVRTAAIKNNMQGALIRIIFSRCLSLPIIAKKELFLTDSQVNNLLQVDIDQVSNLFKSVHDLWALPIQILVACALLYLNIKEAFLVGVAVIVIMIPLNSFIAKRIGKATESLMKAKDARVKVVTEALSNVVSMKMAGLEGAVLGASGDFRAKEMSYLSQRKYLDAVCVFLWALTPVIVPFATFVATVYLDVSLSAAEVVTALALLNMLIFPMNALPWVINGFMEARVSLRRLAKVLSSEDGDTLFVRNRFTRKNRHKVKFSEEVVIEDAAGSDDHEETTDKDSHVDGSALRAAVAAELNRQRSGERSRQQSGEREVRREELALCIPATIWSYATTFQMKHLLGDENNEKEGDGAWTSSPLHGHPAAVAAAVVASFGGDGVDVESQLRSPLLDASASSAVDSTGVTSSMKESLEPLEPPFAVAINEVKLQGPQMVGIVGATGSGKSSVLLGILGEIRGHKRLNIGQGIILIDRILLFLINTFSNLVLMKRKRR